MEGTTGRGSGGGQTSGHTDEASKALHPAASSVAWFMTSDSEYTSPFLRLLWVSPHMCFSVGFFSPLASMSTSLFYACLSFYLSQSLVLVKAINWSKKSWIIYFQVCFIHCTEFCVFCLTQKQAGGWSVSCSSGKQIDSGFSYIWPLIEPHHGSSPKPPNWGPALE